MPRCALHLSTSSELTRGIILIMYVSGNQEYDLISKSCVHTYFGLLVLVAIAVSWQDM